MYVIYFFIGLLAAAGVFLLIRNYNRKEAIKDEKKSEKREEKIR